MNPIIANIIIVKNVKKGGNSINGSNINIKNAKNVKNNALPITINSL